MHSPLSRPAIGALALLALLAACKPQTLTNAPPADPTENEAVAAPPVKLPPAVAATKTYRCADNSLVYIDFLSDNLSANLKKTADGNPIPLAAPEAGKPFTGGGYTVSGSGDTATITQPGKSAQTCTA